MPATHTPSLETAIEDLAQRAIRRIKREGEFAGRAQLVMIHAVAVRAAKDALERHTFSAVLSVALHNRINAMMEGL